MPEFNDHISGAGNVPTAKFGSASNHTEIEEDGTVIHHGDATVWDDQQVQLSGAQLHPTLTPTWIDYKGGRVLQFSNGSTEKIYFTTQLTHKRKADSDFDFHIHHIQPDTGTGNVRWIFTYSISSIDGVFPTETTIVKLAVCDGTIDKHIYHNIVDIVGVGIGISALIICSLTRDGGHVDDTYTGDVLLGAADHHIELDMLGSRQENIK